jgi:PAS domain S-box-containing protein
MRTPAISSRQVRGALLGAALAGAYIGAAKLGLTLDVSHGVITPVWAPSGIALAALLILGVRYWPAVAVGAFVANVTSDASVGVAAGITVGNTLAAVAGTYFVRMLGFGLALDRVRSVLALVVGGALASTAISATNGATVVTLADATEDSFGSAWLLWWFGDAIGVLMVAPALLVLFASRRARPSRARLLEALALLAALAAVGAVVFLGGAWRYPYLVFPFLFWAALRFRQVGAAVASLLVGALATWGAIEGTIPVSADTATGRVQVVQAVFALVAVSLLVVGATLAEREAGRAALLQTASRLSEAQALAHIGSWEWDIRRDVITWSDELYRIFGLAPGAGPMTYATYLEHVHPDDREFLDQVVTRAYGEGKPFALEHRVIRPDGAERVVSGRGRVILEGGEPTFMMGTAQDVTEQRQADRLREDILSAVSHELRTPLTSVLGFALTLERRRKDLPDEAVEATIAELTRAARRLERLLIDLLDVERLRRGLLAVQRAPTDVLALVEAAVAAAPLDGRHVSISGGPLLAEVDAAKVERIVENLVTNAMRHTPPGSAVQVRLDADGTDLLLVVEDDGPGVPDEFKEAVFETFNRGANMLSVTPGTGIGLSLVARFAALHGGRAWVEDAPGGGASFRVRLPDCVGAVAA